MSRLIDRMNCYLSTAIMLAFIPASLYSAVYNVNPTDSAATAYGKIEAAGAGDTVNIAPGTYKFRVSLEKIGTSARPIVIKATDPSNRPLWDLSGQSCDAWPGSYTGGDKGRGAWQVRGSYYQISGIAITGATLAGESCGMRMRGGSSITVKNCRFKRNDNGIEGDGADVLYESCEMDSNGYFGGDMTHNVYVHGGTLVLRSCWIHDPLQGQNLHMRTKDAVVEYCLIENAENYTGDIMTNQVDRAQGESITQTLTLTGNLIIEKQSPANDGQVFVLYNDGGWAFTSMVLRMYYNTFIGNGKNEALVHFTNSTGLASQACSLSNNIFYGNHVPFKFDVTSGVAVQARDNWWPSGYDYTQFTQYMPNSYFGDDPGFGSLAGRDYSLTASAQARGKADAALGLKPVSEYRPVMSIAPRASALDLGAFEFSGTPIQRSNFRKKACTMMNYIAVRHGASIRIFIDGDVSAVGTISELAIFSMQGRMLWKTCSRNEGIGSDIRINMAEWPAGPLIISIKTKDQVLSKTVLLFE